MEGSFRISLRAARPADCAGIETLANAEMEELVSCRVPVDQSFSSKKIGATVARFYREFKRWACCAEPESPM